MTAPTEQGDRLVDIVEGVLAAYGIGEPVVGDVTVALTEAGVVPGTDDVIVKRADLLTYGWLRSSPRGRIPAPGRAAMWLRGLHGPLPPPSVASGGRGDTEGVDGRG